MANDSQTIDGAALVVLGASGDLAQRKLYPALASLARRQRLPKRFALIGAARTLMSETDFRDVVHEAAADAGTDALAALQAHDVTYHYVDGSFDDRKTFERIATMLATCDRDHGTAANRVFYLATVPQVFRSAIEGLGAAGLAAAPDGGSSRVVIEKPFGHDLASARDLDGFVHSVFSEGQIFRIDHYLGKETVQNVLALRFANAIFEPLWNRRYIDHVQITVAESMGVGHRGGFYEQAGALRDIVQNHAMQVLSLVAMEPPASFAADAIRDEKVKALRSVRLLDDAHVGHAVVRGQYDAGSIAGEGEVAGYRDETGVEPTSRTETFVGMRIEIDNWRWSGVPFYLRAGKRLAERVTEVVLRFRPVPHLPLPMGAVDSIEPNSLVLRIQPEEGITLEFGAKEPGTAFRVRTVALDFSYADGFGDGLPEAYERLLLDAFAGDATLFIREDEVDVAWQIVQPVIDATTKGLIPLRRYAAGSWGPAASDALLSSQRDSWRNPAAAGPPAP